MGLFGGKEKNKDLKRAAEAIEFEGQPLDVAGAGTVGSNFQATLPEDVRAIQQNLFGQAAPALDAAGTLVQPQAEAGTQLFGAGADALRSLGSFDPLEAAQTQFQNLEQILNPIRERETASLESRLARQGILTGTAGDRRLGERSAAIERERGLSLLNQFQSAQQAQQTLANLGINLTNAGGAQRESLFGTGAAAPVAGQQLSLPLMQLLGLSTDIGQAQTSAQIAKSGALAQHEASRGGGGGAGALGGIAGGIAGSFFGPAGTAIGSSLGSMLGNKIAGGGGGATSAPAGSVGFGLGGPQGSGGLFTGG